MIRSFHLPTSHSHRPTRISPSVPTSGPTSREHEINTSISPSVVTSVTHSNAPSINPSIEPSELASCSVSTNPSSFSHFSIDES